MAKQNDKNMAGILAMTKQEIKEDLEKTELKLMELRVALSTKQSQETSKVRELNRHRARLRAREKFLEIEQAPQTAKSNS